jgi:N-terminal domain of reverse transcriptase
MKKDFTEIIRLQHTLISNFEVRVLAIRRVAANSKAKTPRIDEIVWKIDLQKTRVTLRLKDLFQLLEKTGKV